MVEPSARRARTKPSDEPITTPEVTEEESKAREEAERNVREAVERENTEAEKTSRIELRTIESNIAIRQLTERLDPKKVDTEKFKSGMEKVMKHLNENYTDANGQLDIKKMREGEEALFDENGKLKVDKLDFLSGEEFDALDEGSKDALNKLVPELIKSAMSVNPRMSEEINKLDLENLTPELIEKFVREHDTQENRDNYNENMAESIREAIKEGKNDSETARSRTTSWADYLRMVLSLLKAVGFGALLWLGVNYALGHQGCMLYTCSKADTFETRMPTMCKSTNGNTFVKLLDPKANTNNFSAEQCSNDLPTSGDPKDCSNTNCDDEDLRPYGPNCTPGDKFKPSGKPTECPHNYYRYDMFNPFSIIPDAIAGGANAAGKAGSDIWEFIKNIIIFVVIVAIIFAVIKIILMVVKAKTGNAAAAAFGKLNKMKFKY
jgi:hypothetical protein